MRAVSMPRRAVQQRDVACGCGRVHAMRRRRVLRDGRADRPQWPVRAYPPAQPRRWRRGRARALLGGTSSHGTRRLCACSCEAGHYCLLGAATPAPEDGVTGDVCDAGYVCTSARKPHTHTRTYTHPHAHFHKHPHSRAHKHTLAHGKTCARCRQHIHDKLRAAAAAAQAVRGSLRRAPAGATSVPSRTTVRRGACWRSAARQPRTRGALLD